MPSSLRRALVGLASVATAASGVLFAPAATAAPATHLIINEVYGGGGNSGATYTHDFVELYNPTGTPLPVAGFTVKYFSSAGNLGNTCTLTGTVAPGAYYLVQQAKGAGGTTALPTPDATCSAAMSGTSGSVSVSDADGVIVDLVGYGSATLKETAAAPNLSNTTSASRTGFADSDNNATDFTVGAPTPQNSATVLPPPDPEPTVAAIAQVQGTGAASPLVGQKVTTTGVVTAVYPTGGFSGVYLQNPGGVRADLLYKQSGTEGDGVVTYAEAASINPFANTLGVLTVTGAQLKAVLEQQWQPKGSSRAFLNLGLSKNVRYTFDETRPQGDRITGVWVNNKAVDPAASYRIATNSFLAGGGDNFGALVSTPPNFVDSGLIDMDQFITWLGKAGTISPDFTKRGVEVVNAPTVQQYGKTKTFTVQGWDMTSNLAPHNRTATLSLLGSNATQKVTIADLHVDGTPTRDGVATVAFKLTGNFLPASNKGTTQYLQLVSDQTGTTVTIPVIVKR